MSNERTSFKCSQRGNFVAMIENSNVPMICCGQPMHELTAHSEGAAHEKHISALSQETAWGPKTQFVRLEHTAEARAGFAMDAESRRLWLKAC